MGYLILSIESSYFLGISNLQFLFWPSGTNSSCISITWERLTRIYSHTSLFSCYFPTLFILSLFLITLTFLPLPNIPYMFNLIYTNTIYIFNSIALIHHPLSFFLLQSPYKSLPNPIPRNYFPPSPIFHSNKLSVFIFRNLRTNKISYLQVFLP